MKYKKEIIYTFLITIAAILLEINLFHFIFKTDQSWTAIGCRSFFWIILGYGTLIYLTTRYAYYRRLSFFKPANLSKLQTFFHINQHSITYLIPSYKEEIDVVRKTLLSAALQKWQNRQIVLLIDDPPNPVHPRDQESLQRAREIIQEIENLLAEPKENMNLIYRSHLKRVKEGKANSTNEKKSLAKGLLLAAHWFRKQGEKEKKNNHTDQVFIKLTFYDRAEELEILAKETLTNNWNLAKITTEFRSLTTLFSAKLSSFERKRYQNLSHSSNKAMNVNSYIGVMGKRFMESYDKNGLHLLESPAGSLSYEDSPYIAILDADTILSHDYSLKLIHEIEKSGNENVAVIQTPYSAFPKAPGFLERAAGATTDLQYITHQGFAHFGATYWVGANAIVRKTALNDIVETIEERGCKIQRFIQDRTVIEDTESSIDLASKGWTLENFPERLSYSATPDDFGSLLIQRRRWANGGLLIFPKLLYYLFQRPLQLRKFKEFFFRCYYLISIPAFILGAGLSFASPAPSAVEASFCILAMLPYLLTYARDLKLNGYDYFDLFRVTSLNLLLIPVNLAGVLKSCQQGLTGKQIPFHRTPKTHDRIQVPGIYIFGLFILLAFILWKIVNLIMNDQWWDIVYQALLLFPLIYALKIYVGLENAIVDIQTSLYTRLPRRLIPFVFQNLRSWL